MNIALRSIKKTAAALTAVVVMSAGASAAGDTVSVRFRVNVDATVTAVQGEDTASMTVAAGETKAMRLPPEVKGTSALRNTAVARGQLNSPTVTGSRGNITLRLPAQAYQNAEVALYSVNGKRVMRGKAAAEQTASGIARRNVAAGVYMLSVNGINGNAFTTRLTHNGGNLNINAAFGIECVPHDKPLAKQADAGDWNITVSAVAEGYYDSSYALNVVTVQEYPLQFITLREKQQITNCGWTWETFDDAPDGGTSSIAISESDCAVTVSGTVTSVYQYGYAGLMAFPDETKLANLKTAVSISFKVKSDGTKWYKIILPTSNITDYSYYSKIFLSTSTESTITVNIDDFKQPEWGKPRISLNKNLLDRIQWQTEDGFTGVFSLTISDLTLTGQGEPSCLAKCRQDFDECGYTTSCYYDYLVCGNSCPDW